MEKLKNFPFALILVAYVLYLGYQLYDFHYAPTGRVEAHKAQLSGVKKEMAELKKKLEEGQKFMKSLDAKRADIGLQIKKLGEYQGALSDALDVPAVIKLLLMESKKIELRVDKIEPARRNQKEFYLEQEFKVEMKGTFQQFLLFAQRISQLQRILRIENYSLKPTLISGTNKQSKYLNAQFSVKAYQYTLSKEDQIGATGGTL